MTKNKTNMIMQGYINEIVNIAINATLEKQADMLKLDTRST
jgi:hypothetical protein